MSRYPFPVYSAPNRNEMGKQAAAYVADLIRNMLQSQPQIRIIFAAAPSQREFFRHLIQEPAVDWNKVTAFHMDEYHTLPASSEALFSRFLYHEIWNHLPVGRIEILRSGLQSLAETEAECERYAQLLNEAPVDLCLLGIGENGHLAFNDPPVADFNDPKQVKEVELDQKCREQQVHDAGFSSLDDVPRTALTLTIPELLKSRYLSVVVPGIRKAEAVKHTLLGEVGEACPASVLRRHPNVTLWLDTDSASLLE